MPELKAKMLGVDSNDQVQTKAWLNRTGVALTVDVDAKPVFNIQFVTAPKVLLQYHRLQGFLSVSRISEEGITFYLTDIPLSKLGENGRPIASSNKVDGVVFCPMTNIVCINDFGPIYTQLSVM